ncbi:MAG: putative ABC transport system permease protein [Planctomycetota bacterium]|jgi:putative ABC transport system permease protein
MGFATTVIHGSLRRRPGRTLFSIFGVAIGIAIVIAIYTVDYNTVLSIGAQRTGKQTDWAADLEVQPVDELGDPNEALAGIEGVQRTTAVFKTSVEVYGQASAEAAAEPERQKVTVISLEAERAPSMGLYILERGESMRTGERDVLIGRAIAEQLGLDVGDTMMIAKPRRAPRKDCIDGEFVAGKTRGQAPIGEPFLVTGVLSYMDLGRTSSGAICIIDFVAGSELFKEQFVRPSYWVERDPNVDLESLRAGLGQSFSYNIREGSVVGQQSDERAFRNGVRLAGLMALALGLFVIFHTLSMSLVERVREVGVLSALGATRAQILRVFFGEAIVISLIAGITGLGGGLLLAWQMLEHSISSLGITSVVRGSFVVPWNESLGLAGLGMGIALLGSVFPMLRAKDSETVRALRGEDLEVRSKSHRGFHFFLAVLLFAVLPVVFFSLVPLVGEGGEELLSVVFLGIAVVALLICTPLMVPGVMTVLASMISAPLVRLSPFSGLLAARSIGRNPTRIAASVAAIALVTAAFVGLRGLTSSLYYETKNWAAESVEQKVWISGLEDTEWRPLAEVLRQDSEVLAVEPNAARVQSPFRIVGIPLEEAVLYGPLADDEVLRRDFKGSNGILITSRVASQRGLSVHDIVPIATPSQGVKSFRVLAITDAYGYFADPHERAYGVIADKHMSSLFCLDTDTATGMAVRLRSADDLDATMVRIATATRGFYGSSSDQAKAVNFASGSDIRRHELRDITRDFLVFDIVIFLTLLIAGTGVLNGQLLSAMERVKELGVLRALGASGKQIRDSVLLESVVIGAAGSVLGVVIGFGLVFILVDALKILSGLDLPRPGFELTYLLAAIGSFLVTIVAGLYPIWRMNRMDPIKAVRTG